MLHHTRLKLLSLALFSWVLVLTYAWKRQEMHGFYNLPVLPAQLPEVSIYNTSTGKYIPKKLWIAVKDRKDELPGHLLSLFERNRGWEVILCDNDCKDDFMFHVFANTSIAWAYSVINPLVGAAKADIWRYAVLYTYGGVYLDDDSDMKTPFDDVISATDRLIMSEEGSSSLGDCYIPTYSLSETATYARFPNFSHALHFSGMVHRGKGSAPVPSFFHDHTLVNWGIFTRPRHPLFLRALQHIVEIVTSEYQRVSVIHLTRWDVRWKQVMCATGFVLTYSVRELELEKSLEAEDFPRISVNNYQQYKGNVKAFWTGGDPNHYMKAMQRKHGPHLLKEFGPLNLPAVLAFLEGRTVMGDGGKEIFLVLRGKLMTFPSYDLFLKLGFSDKGVRHVSDHLLNMIPRGGELSENTAVADVTPQTPALSLPAPAPAPAERSYVRSSYPTLLQQLSAPKPLFSEKDDVFSYLSKVKRALDDSSDVTCFGDDYDGSRDDVLSRRWQKVFQDFSQHNSRADVTMVFPFCLRTFQLGNTLGYYLNDVACADLAGSHFLAVRAKFDVIDPTALVAQGSAQLTFFQHLPNLIVHPSPKPADDVRRLMKEKCHCLQFCWENSEAPWLSRTHLIPAVLLPAINAYTRLTNAEALGTTLNNATDYSTLPLSTPLPLLPNVTIQYRCGDNIGFGKTKYGLLPFSAYRKHGRIPRELARYIYVIADSPTRSANHPYSHRCDAILKSLFEDLRAHFPEAVVVVKRGGDPFLDYTRIAYSSVVFCSASTFCLWPALANPIGHVYYPLTPLVARAATNDTAPDFGPRFHWISDVAMIKEFKHYRPWHRLIDDLQTKE